MYRRNHLTERRSHDRSKGYLDPVFLKAVENQATKVVVQRGFTNTINVRAIAP